MKINIKSKYKCEIFNIQKFQYLRFINDYNFEIINKRIFSIKIQIFINKIRRCFRHFIIMIFILYLYIVSLISNI